MDFRETGWGVGWIQLAQDRYRWWALVNKFMNLLVLTQRSWLTLAATAYRREIRHQILHSRTATRADNETLQATSGLSAGVTAVVGQEGGGPPCV
jgi:hypothetical protein